MRKPRGYWKKPENIDREFDELVETLRRIPKAEEMPGASCHSIQAGNYHPGVRSFNDYLRHWGFETNNEWSPSRINDAFYDTINELRRLPIRSEIKKKGYSGMLRAIDEGRYSERVMTWNQLLEHHGFKKNHAYKHPGIKRPRGYWTAERIIEEFYDTFNKLRRVPKAKDLDSGALGAISDGRYLPEIRTLNQFLKYNGLQPNLETYKWSRMGINEELYNKINELRRIPNCMEIHRSALESIKNGRYDPRIRNWSQFLRFHGLVPNRDHSGEDGILGEVLK